MRLRPSRTAGTSSRASTVRSVVAAVTVPALLAVLAIINPGVKIAEVDLNDGAVWLTNAQGLKLGRYNATVRELNAGLIATDPGFDVLQDAQDVVLTEPGKLSVVDTASVTLAAQAEIPAGAQVSMAGGVVVIVGEDGNVWVRTTATLTTIDAETPGDLQLADGALATVTSDGVVLAFDPSDGGVHRVEMTAGALEQERVATLTDAADVEPDEVAAVGESLVVRAGSTLHGEGWTANLEEHGTGAVLQQSSAAADVVLASTTTEHLRIDLEDGSVDALPTGGSGAPARPVSVGDCTHAAWASATGSYVMRCGDGDPEIEDLEGMTASDTLAFRVNRSVVILNDTAQGRVWLPEDLPKVQEPNWQDIEQEEEPDEQEDTSEDVQTAQQLLSQCTEQSATPGAADDDLGVRPGRTTILQVLDNDTAGECGIIAISAFDPIPETFGYLETVYGGRALQAVIAPDAQGSVTFTYTITDGRGQNPPSTATVTLTARAPGENAEPVQLRTGSVEVEQGATIEYDALANFADPDGDDLLLTSAVTDGVGAVRARQDGIVTFIADGDVLGRQTVQLTVSDGIATVVGEMFVDVRSAGSLPPVIDPVHAVTYVGQPVDVDVLASVRSASREPVRLASVEEVAGTTIEPKLEDGRFAFTAPNPGTYYVGFTVVASPQQATGLARVDVREWPGEPLPPIAVRDLALLPLGGEVTVDPMANDRDPNGGVLVLTSVTAAPDSALRVAVIEHRLVTITSQRALETPETLTYVVSNGVSEARGEILVQPVPPSADQHAPVVQDVEVSVRTGGVVTIPALDYAYDADGDEMELVPELAEPLGDGQGLLFVSGDQLRYQAPSTPTTARAVFSVRDSVGNVGAGRLTVTVHESNAATKSPPRPKDLTARTFDGETVRVTVPLTGIDPDGDGVVLLGQGDTAPKKGRISEVGADWIEYEAFPGESGTDTFTYAVEDWVGQRAVATVRVGIARRPAEVLPIVAQDDEVTLQPGQRVEVRVLRNDVDPSGGELTLLPELEVPDGVVARTEGRRIVVEAPQEVGVPISIVYTVTNERGGRASAVLTVYVVADATIVAPVAGDVTVAPIDIIGKTSVEVDVFEVAENPSGPLSDLEVSVPSSHSGVASVTSSDKVLVTLTDEAQTVPYLLTNTHPDANGVHAYAFITVPALGDFPPVLRPKARELRVASGTVLTIPIAEFVQVGTGKTARIGDTTLVSATRSDGSELVVDETTLRYTSEIGYAGPASITFQVTDGAGRDDVTGRRATLTLPITVYSEEDYPPTFTPSVIEIPQGDAAAAVDLLGFAEGPEGADGAQPYTFRLAGTPTPGFTATLTGTTLQVVAAPGTPRGTTGSAQLTLGYGRAGSLAVEVQFRVVASTRALVKVTPDVAVDGAAGVDSRVAVPVVFNPFPDSAVSVLGATVETPGAGTASVSGSTVVVRPVAGFVGSMVVRYRVQDATGDPLREVEGRISVNVRDAPDAPGAPRAGGVTSQTVVLAWDAPTNNGSPITGYRLTRSPGGQTTSCVSTTCTVSGLTNGTAYTFTVAAQNAIGWSPESSASSSVTPDAVPDVPGAPTLVFGDGQVTASWNAPNNPGTPITQYTTAISPLPTGSGATRTTSGTSVTYTGLTNGTEYRVQVRAHNSATPPEGGSWSEWSDPVRPAGVPGAPTVTASRVDTALGGQIAVSWDAAAPNGDPVAEYVVTVSGAGQPTQSVSRGTSTSWAFTNAVNGVEYTFSVTARNKAGTGSAGSTSTSTFTTPDAPSSPSISADTAGRAYGNGRVVLSWGAPASMGGVGVGLDRYEIEGLPPVGTATSLAIDGLPGGTTTTSYKVRACSTRGVCGPWASIGSATPVTVPQAPSVSVVGGYDNATVTWSAGGTGGSALTSVEYAVGAPRGWAAIPSSGFVHDAPVTSGDSQPLTIYVRATNAAGTSAVASATGTVQRLREPGAPGSVSAVSPDVGILQFSWTAATGFGTPVSGYQYRLVRPGTPTTPDTPAWQAVPSGSPVTLSGQPPGDVRVEVRADSAEGEGAASFADVTVLAPRLDPPPDPGSTDPGNPGGGG